MDIELYKEDNTLEFIKYLLKQKKALEEMIIYYSPEEFPHHSNTTTAIEKFKEASSIASIYLLPKAAQLFCICFPFVGPNQWPP